MRKNQFPVVVTTQHRGVFFGYLQERPQGVPESLRLEHARMCVYWPTDEHGVLGLAARGPVNGSRVGPAIPSIYINAVTAIMEMTDAAVRAWDAEPWQN